MDTSTPETIPSEAAATDRLVHFTAWPLSASGGDHARQVRFGLYGFTFLLIFGAAHLGLGGSKPPLIPVLLAALVVAVIVFARWSLSRVSRESVRAAEGVMGPRRPEARVCCHGDPPQVARVLARGEIRDALFEPRIFLGMGTFAATGHQRTAQWIAGVMALGLMMWLQHRFIGGTGNWYLDAIAAMGAGVVVGTLAFPTYVRVVPGRLDVMQCGFLGKLILSRRSIDLRGVRVVVDLATDVIMISDGKGVPPIGYAAVWDRAAFVNAVLMAAVSTHTPPPLPDDALVG